MTTTDPTPTTPATGRIEILRTALREVVAACGGLATAEVTDEFLCLAPGEVRAQLAKARRATPLAATREAPPLAQQGAEITREQAVALYTEVMAAHNCQTLGEMAEHFARAVWARAQAARPAKAPVPQLGAGMSRESILEWLRNDPAWGVVIAPKCWRAEDDDLLELIQRAVAWARAQAARPAAELVPQQAEISVEDVADLASAVLAGAQPASPEPEGAAEISDEELAEIAGAADLPWEMWEDELLSLARAVWARAQGARPAIQPVAVSKPVARLMYWNEKGGPALRITRVARTYEEMPEGQNSYWDEGEPLYLAADQQEGRDDA